MKKKRLDTLCNTLLLNVTPPQERQDIDQALMSGFFSRSRFVNEIEGSLHVCLNLLTCYCFVVTSSSQLQPAVDFFSVYVFTALSGAMSCSLLPEKYRLSSWISFNLLCQLAFLVLLIIEGDQSIILFTSSGLFSLLFVLHIFTSPWDDSQDVIRGLAVAMFYINLIVPAFHSYPGSTCHIISASVLFWGVHVLKWLSNNESCSPKISVLDCVCVVTLGALQAYFWSLQSVSMQVQGVGSQSLVVLMFAVCVRLCRLDLSPPELLVLLCFVKLTILGLASLFDPSNSACAGEYGDDVLSSYLSRRTVLAVSGIGFLGTLLIGIISPKTIGVAYS